MLIEITDRLQDKGSMAINTNYIVRTVPFKDLFQIAYNPGNGVTDHHYIDWQDYMQLMRTQAPQPQSTAVYCGMGGKVSR